MEVLIAEDEEDLNYMVRNLQEEYAAPLTINMAQCRDLVMEKDETCDLNL